MKNKTFFKKGGFLFGCKTTLRRDGFNHVCRVFRDGELVTRKVCQYYNRTWESFDFESVLNKAARALGLDDIKSGDRYYL